MTKSFLNLLATNYDKLFNYTGSSSPISSFSVALQYALADRTYNGLEHEAVIKKLKMPQPLGSVMHGYGNDPILIDKIAAKFIIEGDVEQSIQQLHERIEILKGYGFSSGYNLNYSALFLLDETHAARAKQFFDEMKRHQRFLTRKADYPITVILTQQPHDPKQLANTMVQYYTALKSDLKSGDQLQMLAQFLTSYSLTFEPKLVQYTLHIKRHLEAHAVKVPRNAYPLLGLLALNATTEETLQRVLTLQKEIIMHKKFYNYPEMALTGAVLKTLTDEYTAGALTNEASAGWLHLMFSADLLFTLPKALLDSLFSADFNIFN